MSGTFARLVPEPIYSQQAEAVLHQCPRWQRRHFRRALLKKGSVLIRRYRAARSAWDSSKLGETTLQWIIVYIQGYVALIDALGRRLRVHAIFTERAGKQWPFVRMAFALLRRSESSHSTRVLELTLEPQVKNTLVLGLYLLVGSRSRVRRFSVFEDIDSTTFVFALVSCLTEHKDPIRSDGALPPHSDLTD